LKVENIAYTCTTKFSMSGNSLKPILHWIHSDLSEVDYTHQSFETGSNQIAAVLKNLGIQPGEVVSIFLPRSPDLINAFFAILKNKAISCILFSTLGEEALFDRLENCKAKIIITRKSLLKKIMAIKEKLPDLQTILLIDIEEHQSVNVLSLKKLMTGTKGVFTYAHFVDSETPAFLQYTSGSTGKPKGALHVHGALADMLHSFDEIMQPQPGNVYWCTADPAWITGLVYGIIVPFCTGITQIQFDGTYKAESWMKILEDQHVSIWYTAPTALRMLMQEDIHFDAFNFSSLKRIYSVGEPLNPEIYFWGRRTFNKEIYDTWFQSETGCIMVANRPGRNIKPGSMGIPRTGVEILICDDHMQKLPDGTQGHLCVRKGWGSMFRTYYRKEAAYNEKFNGDIYVTGDLAWKDEDGFIWYVSRSRMT
jgi:acetyl-CoA synthetase